MPLLSLYCYKFNCDSSKHYKERHGKTTQRHFGSLFSGGDVQLPLPLPSLKCFSVVVITKANYRQKWKDNTTTMTTISFLIFRGDV